MSQNVVYAIIGFLVFIFIGIPVGWMLLKLVWLMVLGVLALIAEGAKKVGKLAR